MRVQHIALCSPCNASCDIWCIFAKELECVEGGTSTKKHSQISRLPTSRRLFLCLKFKGLIFWIFSSTLPTQCLVTSQTSLKILWTHTMTNLISAGILPVKLRPNFRRIPSPLHILTSVRVCLEGVSDVRS